MDKVILEQLLKIPEQIGEFKAEIKTGMEGIKSEIADMRLEMSDLKNRMSNVESEITNIKTELKNQNERIGKLENKLDECIVDISNQNERIGKLENKLDECIVDISEMFRDVFIEFGKKVDRDELENIQNKKCS